MSEAEILQLRFHAADTVLTIFSMFFGIVSAYIAGLYFFLHKAPLLLKTTAFALLTSSFLFLGGTAASVQRVSTGIVDAWPKLGAKATGITSLRELEIPTLLSQYTQRFGLVSADMDGYTVAVSLGWIVAFAVYGVLGYMTFFYRWRFLGDGLGRYR